MLLSAPCGNLLSQGKQNTGNLIVTTGHRVGGYSIVSLTHFLRKHYDSCWILFKRQHGIFFFMSVSQHTFCWIRNILEWITQFTMNYISCSPPYPFVLRIHKSCLLTSETEQWISSSQHALHELNQGIKCWIYFLVFK